jgi:hypothetical protein
MVIEKKIHGFEVTLDTDMDNTGREGERVTGCWINKGDYSGSLALLEHLGGLEDRDGNDLEVSPGTIEAISKWAEKHGY